MGMESWTEGSGGGALLAVAISILLMAWLNKLQRSRQGHREEFPPAPPGWPILGHLMLLKKAPHKVLADLCWNQGYGRLFGLRLGSVPAVVVSSVPLAKDVLHTHDKILANRPDYLFVNDLYYGYDSGAVFSAYNPRWAWMRKIYTLELFTAKRLEQLQHIRLDEVRQLLQRLRHDSAGGKVAVDVGSLLADTTSNTTARLLQSKTVAGAALDLPDLVHCLETEAFPVLGDFIPSLAFLDFFNVRRRQRIHRRIDEVIECILQERRHLMARCSPHVLPHDFLQVLLSKEGTTKDEEHLTTNEIKAMILDMFAGGVHTSAVTLEWAVVELLKSPECMRKLREEVDGVMGNRQDLVNDEDVTRMPYLESTVREVLRVHPVLPLLFPRVASEALKLDKYVLPKGTNIIVNAWAIARDPLYWPTKPQEFWPDRFLRGQQDVDIKGQHFELLPFGAGRRVCPGLRLGLAIVHLTLANLLRSFDWELPPGQSPSSIDMADEGGISTSKVVPTLVIPKARNFSLLTN